MPTETDNRSTVELRLENLHPEHVTLVKRVVALIVDPDDSRTREMFFSGQLALMMRENNRPMFVPVMPTTVKKQTLAGN